MPCNSVYCISGTGSYDGNYGIGPTQINGYDYFTGDTSPTYYIFYNSGSTTPSWCLSTYVNGPCLLFGKSPCLSSCPDLCDDFFGVGPCPPPTPTPVPDCIVNFDAFFDCDITPTPTPSPTATPTATPTPTPTPTSICNSVSMVVTATNYPPTPTATATPTPTPTPDVTRSCSFNGVVTFNTIDGNINCATSKKFIDCATGKDYYSAEIILDPIGNPLKPDYVYGGLINGISSCFIFFGLVDNISGVDKIDVTIEYGPEDQGSCILCGTEPTPTATPSVTLTPTATPSVTLTPTPSATPVPINPICQTCNIGFDFYDQNPIAVISVGTITASCETNVTDYVIEWYGPGLGSTNVQFTSGLGTDYIADYLYTHPLTGTSQVPVIAGEYTPVISKIKLGGIEYTNLNCFDFTTVNADALTCTNGEGSDNPNYSHKLEFSATVEQAPQPVSTTFILDPLKPYFAFRFEGDTIYDTLLINFYGSSYPTPIILENITQGVDVSETNFDLSLIPKKAKPFVLPTNFSKVLNLSNLIVNPGDYLQITISPNPFNNNTNWKFYCECLETFNCDVCYDTNITQPFKIKQSTINVSTPTACGLVNIGFSLSACTNSDLLKYILPGIEYEQTQYYDSYYNITALNAGNLSPISQNFCNFGGFTFPSSCNAPSTSTITYNKTVSGGQGLISMTFTDVNDLLTYYNDWQSKYISYSGNPTDCTDIDYYRYFVLRIPLAVGSDTCGDTTGFQDYFIHPSAIVTTGGTGPYTMTITMPTISKCITFSPCDLNCNINEDVAINQINISSTGITNNISIINNTGSRLITPIREVSRLTYSTNILSGISYNDYMAIPKYVNETIPYSGSPLTIIPSLSGKTCDFLDWKNISTGTPVKNLSYYRYDSIYYNVRVTNPLNPQDFEIWAPTFINGVFNGYPGSVVLNKIYERIGGIETVIDPSYFV
jgi:hypothetical protein